MHFKLSPEMYNHMISLLPTPEVYAATHGRLTGANRVSSRFLRGYYGTKMFVLSKKASMLYAAGTAAAIAALGLTTNHSMDRRPS